MRDQSSNAGRSLFTTTHWSVVMAAQSESPEAADALETLCRGYWYPLYAYVRRRGHGVSEAEDLTQEFFARLLHKGFPAGVLPEGGKFRSYLLVALKNFLINDWNSRQTAKRGAGEIPISLDELGAEARYRAEPADEATPDRLFERRWASTLLDNARGRLREEFAAEGRAALFDKLKASLTDGSHIQML